MTIEQFEQIEKVVQVLRPQLIAFLQTKRTVADAAAAAAAAADPDYHVLFMAMSNDKVCKETYSDVQSLARKLTIGILRHPHIDYDLQEVWRQYGAYVAAIQCGQEINTACEELDTRFWTKLWADMEEGYYDDFMKHMLILRIEMLQHKDCTTYTTQTIMDFFDIAYIKKNLLLRTYNFMSVLEFVRAFIVQKLHPVLHEPFGVMCGNFVAEMGSVEANSNEATVRILQFILKNALDYLYLDVIKN